MIFITGAVTLSLEVLASRIMTPYFGVSLYIWAGILSITLIFLALGYQLGGRMSQRREKDSLPLSLLSAPLWAALSIVVAAAIYPVVFPWLSTTNLILASFLGGTILLALASGRAFGHEPLAHRPGPRCQVGGGRRGGTGLFYQHRGVGGRGGADRLPDDSVSDQFSRHVGDELGIGVAGWRDNVAESRHRRIREKAPALRLRGDPLAERRYAGWDSAPTLNFSPA